MFKSLQIIAGQSLCNLLDEEIEMSNQKPFSMCTICICMIIFRLQLSSLVSDPWQIENDQLGYPVASVIVKKQCLGNNSQIIRRNRGSVPKFETVQKRT